jgi:integrase
MAKLLTDASIARLKPKPGQRYDVVDPRLPGLIVHVTPTGSKSFMLKRRFPGSKHPTRRRIGEVGAMKIEQARETARQWLTWLDSGIDPADEIAEQKRRTADEQALTFTVVADEYIAKRLHGRRQGERSAREIAKELIPVWGERRINAITRGDVIRLIDDIKARIDRNAQAAGRRATHAYAHIIFSHCRALFNFAVPRYDLPKSPCDRLKPKDIIGAKKPGQRVLNDAELRALWRATEGWEDKLAKDDPNDHRMGYPFGPLFQLLVLTGARKSEVSDARWAEFDLDARLWTIPPERFKTGAAHIIPLTDNMIVLLGSLPRFKHGGALFSTTFGAKPVNGFSKAKSRLDRLMREQLGGELQPFTIHDIRRTMRTRLSELRIPEHIAEAAIGHAKRGIVAVYNRARYADELREAFEAWAARLNAIVNPAAADNVVPLRTGA